MREIVFEQTQRVQAYLERENKQFDLTVLPAMTYGNPGIDAVLEKLSAHPQEHVILLPLFPQYSATSTAPLYDAFAKWIPTQRNLPGLTIIKDYYQHPMFIQALAESVLAYQSNMENLKTVDVISRYSTALCRQRRPLCRPLPYYSKVSR